MQSAFVGGKYDCAICSPITMRSCRRSHHAATSTDRHFSGGLLQQSRRLARLAARPSRCPPSATRSHASDCTSAKLGSEVPLERIGEPVRRVTLAAPAWTAATATSPGYCRVDGVIEPVDTAATARPINFAVVLPAQWSRRAAQLGGGGLNGTIPNLTGGAGPARGHCLPAAS